MRCLCFFCYKKKLFFSCCSNKNCLVIIALFVSLYSFSMEKELHRKLSLLWSSLANGHYEDLSYFVISNRYFEISFQTLQNLALEHLLSLPAGKGKVVPGARKRYSECKVRIWTLLSSRGDGLLWRAWAHTSFPQQDIAKNSHFCIRTQDISEISLLFPFLPRRQALYANFSVI